MWFFPLPPADPSLLLSVCIQLRFFPLPPGDPTAALVVSLSALNWAYSWCSQPIPMSYPRATQAPAGDPRPATHQTRPYVSAPVITADNPTTATSPQVVHMAY